MGVEQPEIKVAAPVGEIEQSPAIARIAQLVTLAGGFGQPLLSSSTNIEAMEHCLKLVMGKQQTAMWAGHGVGI
jgi:hypothetical protein